MTSSVTFVSFDGIRDAVMALPDADAGMAAAARAREQQLTKPAGSLGRLEEIAEWLAAWQGRHPPRVDQVRTLVFAGNHGVTVHGVSAFPASVTAQMVANFEAGGAAVNQLCAAVGAELRVTALALDEPTADLATEAAMSEEACLAAFNTGYGSVDRGLDLLCLGEMGIGNTTVAAAVSAALFGGAAEAWVGPGTGLDQPGIQKKCAVVAQGLACHGEILRDPLQALRCLGGRELAAMAGAALAARMNRVPVLMDGYVCSAALAVLHAVRPGALDHVMAAHRSAEPAHGKLLEALGKQPLLTLDMRLGEASGAALAVAIVRAAALTHANMATFSEARVDSRLG